jgi:formamidopyrimidine-DNA glycosylase
VTRRAKYLLLGLAEGDAIVHLGMSGSLRVVAADLPAQLHDHLDLVMSNGKALRFHDPRRFGCWLWQARDTVHPLLAQLGPEPLGESFDDDHLWRASRGRAASVKTFLMDQRIVVGVGNIYAAEALFRAGIHPARAAGRVSRERYRALSQAVRAVLAHAIARGGTTLRDYVNAVGEPGYFELELDVYGRAGEPCPRCAAPLRNAVIGQRASVYCPRCQR